MCSSDLTMNDAVAILTGARRLDEAAQAEAAPGTVAAAADTAQTESAGAP